MTRFLAALYTLCRFVCALLWWWRFEGVPFVVECDGGGNA